MKRTTNTIKHYPVRVDTFIHLPTHYVAWCGYESDNPADFCRPEKPEKITCPKCAGYDKNKES